MAEETDNNSPIAYSMTYKTIFTIEGNGHISEFNAFMPVAQSNEYQTIWKVETSEGRITEETNYGNKMLYLHRNSLPSNPYEMFTTTHITPKVVEIDCSKITEFKRYDPKSEPCLRHLGNRGNIVDTSNVDIQQIADELWKGSKDYLAYARKCYDYVSSHFEYDMDARDWNSLSRILKNGGGGSADLSSLMVTLLRYKGIPARHNVCVTFGQEYHTFVDFYLEGHGWIPLDAARKNQNPDGEYFGVYDGSCIVLAQDIFYEISVYPDPVNILQRPVYFCTISNDHTTLTAMPLLQNNGVSGIRTTKMDKQTDGKTYNLQGQQVNAGYKGIIISNRKKQLRR